VGTWGSGSFENDAALDRVVDLEASETLEPVRRALALAADGYSDIEDAGAAIR
jgi:hypothetical protein